MGELFDQIRRLVLAERYMIGQHASERLEERGILEWQVVDGIASGKLINERPDDQPNPAVEVAQLLADGRISKRFGPMWLLLTRPSW